MAERGVARAEGAKAARFAGTAGDISCGRFGREVLDVRLNGRVGGECGEKRDVRGRRGRTGGIVGGAAADELFEVSHGGFGGCCRWPELPWRRPACLNAGVVGYVFGV